MKSGNGRVEPFGLLDNRILRQDRLCSFNGLRVITLSSVSFAAFISCVFAGVIKITDTGISSWSVSICLFNGSYNTKGVRKEVE